MKDKIRPIYSELQGILHQAPEKDQSIYNEDKRLWEKFNELLDSLKTITNDGSYESSKLVPIHGDGYSYVSGQMYRTNISGLILKLHGTYFSDERPPFSGPEPANVTQTQFAAQSQNVSVEVAVQIGMDLQKALEKAETPEEKSFIEGLKSKIGTVKSYADFLLLVVSTAQAYGITLENIEKLFKGVLN